MSSFVPQYWENRKSQEKMKSEKGLGIWMDHHHAHLMEFSSDPIITTSLESPFTHVEKESTLGRSENLMHRKEQHEEAEYYKSLGEVIIHYTEVLLFGPTDANLELFNLLRKNHLFNEIKIDILPADKMTENQQHAFVRDFFSKRFFLA